MNIKLLTEHHLEFLSLKGGAKNLLKYIQQSISVDLTANYSLIEHYPQLMK